MRNPYRILGIPVTADAERIKTAYRRLAKEFHPDLHPGNPEIEARFKEASGAYDLLSDPAKRRQFDLGLIDGEGRPRHREAGLTPDDEGGFFRDFGVARERQSVRMRGADVAYRVEIGFLDAARGAKKRLTLNDGTKIDFRIPPGTAEGDILRLKGQGLAGQGGAENGDALIETTIGPHPFFRREGLDIHLDCPISLAEAALGATIAIPTLAGEAPLRIPKGSNSGHSLRLTGAGIRIETEEQMIAGDLIAHLVVHLPDLIDPDLERAIQRWARLTAFDPRQRFKRG